MARHAAPSRHWRQEIGDDETATSKRKAPWIIAGAVTGVLAIAGGIYAVTSDNPALSLRETTVAQGDVIDTEDGRKCVIGVTDVTRAWTSESCVKPGEDVAVNGRVIGVGGDVSANGLASIDLHQFVNVRNDFDDVTVTPASKDGSNFDGVDVCATGEGGTIYGCEPVGTTGNYVATVAGFHEVPAGTPVWVRSSVSDADSNAAQLFGLVAVPGDGKDNPAIVSLIPLVGDNGEVVANTADTDGAYAGNAEANMVEDIAENSDVWDTETNG